MRYHHSEMNSSSQKMCFYWLTFTILPDTHLSESSYLDGMNFLIQTTRKWYIVRWTNIEFYKKPLYYGHTRTVPFSRYFLFRVFYIYFSDESLHFDYVTHRIKVKTKKVIFYEDYGKCYLYINLYPLPIFNCLAWRQPLEVHQFLRFSSQRFHLWQEFCSLGIHKISIATDILKIMLVFEKGYLPISFPDVFVFLR